VRIGCLASFGGEVENRPPLRVFLPLEQPVGSRSVPFLSSEGGSKGFEATKEDQERLGILSPGRSSPDRPRPGSGGGVFGRVNRRRLSRRERDADERRAGREAPFGERGMRVAVLEALGRFPEGGDEEGVGFPHFLADGLPKGVEQGSGGLLGAVGAGRIGCLASFGGRSRIGRRSESSCPSNSRSGAGASPF
jgi:hypothetical protein